MRIIYTPRRRTVQDMALAATIATKAQARAATAKHAAQCGRRFAIVGDAK